MVAASLAQSSLCVTIPLRLESYGQAHPLQRYCKIFSSLVWPYECKLTCLQLTGSTSLGKANCRQFPGEDTSGHSFCRECGGGRDEEEEEDDDNDNRRFESVKTSSPYLGSSQDNRARRMSSNQLAKGMHPKDTATINSELRFARCEELDDTYPPWFFAPVAIPHCQAMGVHFSGTRW